MRRGFFTRGPGTTVPGRAGASAGASSLAPAPTYRRRVALGLALAGAVLIVPSVAQAAQGDGPGGLSLDKDHGLTSDFPIANYSTAHACPVTNRARGFVDLLQSDGLSALNPLGAAFTPSDTPPSGVLNSNTLAAALAGRSSGDFEIGVLCRDVNGADVVADSVWISVDMTAHTWQLWQGGSNPVATTTTLTAAPSTADQGADVTLTAQVSAGSGTPAGSVEFRNGATSLGTAAVSGGSASKVVSDLPVGSNSITAVFTPTDTSAFAGSTSSAVAVTINAAGGSQTGHQTINVNIPSSGSDGAFTLTVSPDAVTMSEAAASGGQLTSTGTLSPVTVDHRNGRRFHRQQRHDRREPPGLDADARQWRQRREPRRSGRAGQ